MGLTPVMSLSHSLIGFYLFGCHREFPMSPNTTRFFLHIPDTPLDHTATSQKTNSYKATLTLTFS